jgi:hypothetical protein
MSFKKDAQQHQLLYFPAEINQYLIEKRKGRAQQHWLSEEAAGNGNIFYSNYEIHEAARKGLTNKLDTPEWFYDTSRSQHIPFNFFIPLIEEKELAKKTLNNLLKAEIKNIENINIEFPPKSKNPLKDRTSFDVFVSFSYDENKKGMVGIEVKYTEGGYSPGETEKKYINDPDSVYYVVTRESGLYNKEKIIRLKENAYRQIWRNHLLAYAFAKANNYDNFFSLTLYHDGNTHFRDAFRDYNAFLSEKGRETLVQATFSKFCETMLNEATSEKQKNWINYLLARYNIKIIRLKEAEQ